ncbi:MAG: plasmid pRiA4b ORF-3 family protein [Myxococcaceae bacterium]
MTKVIDDAIACLRRVMTETGAPREDIEEAVKVLGACAFLYGTFRSPAALAAGAQLALARRDGRDEVTAGELAKRYGTHPPAVGRLATTISETLVLEMPPIPSALARELGVQDLKALQRRLPQSRAEANLRQLLARAAREVLPPKPLHELVRFSGDAKSVTYVLRVSLAWKPTVWRDLELRGDQTLDELHGAIQEAFGWDNDHLWCFFMAVVKGKFRLRRQQPDSTYGNSDDALSPHVPLAHFALRPRRRFSYLFDFGDNLLHLVTVQKAGKPEAGVAYPRRVAESGAAPSQYGDEPED